jgi:hypothetical protein
LKNCVASKKQYKHLKSKYSSQDESLPCSFKNNMDFWGRGNLPNVNGWWFCFFKNLCGVLDLQLALFFSVHCQKRKVKIDGIKFWDLLFYSVSWSWYMSKMRWLWLKVLIGLKSEFNCHVPNCAISLFQDVRLQTHRERRQVCKCTIV